MKKFFFIFKVINLWGIKNFLKIILGEIYFFFKKNKFYYENKTKFNPHIPTPKYILDDIYKLIHFKRKDKILDLGSGSGRILYYFLNKKFLNLHGVELSKNLIKITKSNPKFNKHKITLYNKNFLEYKISRNTKFIFIYDPAGYKVMKKLFINFNKILKKKTILIYITPIYLDLLLKYKFKILFKSINKNKRGFCILEKI